MQQKAQSLVANPALVGKKFVCVPYTTYFINVKNRDQY
jgi:hypothetical protein